MFNTRLNNYNEIEIVSQGRALILSLGEAALLINDLQNIVDSKLFAINGDDFFPKELIMLLDCDVVKYLKIERLKCADTQYHKCGVYQLMAITLNDKVKNYTAAIRCSDDYIMDKIRLFVPKKVNLEIIL